MRKTLLTIATVGLLGLSTMGGAFAQAALTPTQARAAAVLACTGGTQTACSDALAVLTAAIRAANPATTPAAIAAVNALILTEFKTVSAAVRRAGSTVNVAVIDQVFSVAVPDEVDTPSASPV